MVVLKLTGDEISDLSYIFMESLASSVDDLAMMHPDYIKVSYTES